MKLWRHGSRERKPICLKVPSSYPGSGFIAGVFFGYSGFLSRSKNIHVRLTGHSKLSLDGNGCSSNQLRVYKGYRSEDGLQHACDAYEDKRFGKWIEDSNCTTGIVYQTEVRYTYNSIISICIADNVSVWTNPCVLISPWCKIVIVFQTKVVADT